MQVTPPFDSMEELVHQSEYKWTLVDGTYYGGYFKVGALLPTCPMAYQNIIRILNTFRRIVFKYDNSLV